MEAKKPINSKKLLIYGLPVIILLFIFLMWDDGGKKEEAPAVQTTATPLPDAESSADTSKTAAYSSAERFQQEKERIAKQSAVTDQDFYGMEAATEKKTVEVVEEKVEAKPTTTARRSVRSATPKQPVAEKESEPVAVAVPEPVRDGFGVAYGSESEERKVVAKKSTAAVPSGDVASETDFIPIMLEESCKVTNNSTVVFITKKPFMFRNIRIEKNAYVFCKAKASGDIFDLRVTRIKNVDAKIYDLQNFYVFDEKYSRGFQVEGLVNSALKEGTNEELSSTESPSVVTGNIGVDAAMNVLTKGTRKLGKSQPSVNLEKGYKVFIKKEE